MQNNSTLRTSFMTKEFFNNGPYTVPDSNNYFSDPNNAVP